MPLNIENPEAGDLPRKMPHSLRDKLMEISDRCASLPDLDTKSDEDAIDFDKFGVPR